jgi:hypothetical protein
MKRLLALTLGVALAGIGTAALATRNSSGTYSLPQSPFISGTVINSSTMNSQFGDIAQSLTDSLDRNGKGPMLAPLRVQNGSNTAPSLSFNNDQDTGLYLVGDANPAMTIAGTKRQEWTSAGTAVTGNATVSGTLGVTGSTSLAGATATTLTSTGDITANTNINLPTSGNQGVWKSNGALQVGTLTANNMELCVGGVAKWAIGTDGKLTSAGGTIAGLPAPSAATDVMRYGDSFADPTVTTITSNANWGSAAAVRVWKDRNGTVHLRGRLTLTNASGGSPFTLPVGFRPDSGKDANVLALVASGGSSFWQQWTSPDTGVVIGFQSAPAHSLTLNDTYDFRADFHPSVDE